MLAIEDQMLQEADDVLDHNQIQLGNKKHTCTKMFVRSMGVFTCLYIAFRWLHQVTYEINQICKSSQNCLEMYFEENNIMTIELFFQQMLYLQFPIFSLLTLTLFTLLCNIKPHVALYMPFRPSRVHTFCLFSLFCHLVSAVCDSLNDLNNIIVVAISDKSAFFNAEIPRSTYGPQDDPNFISWKSFLLTSALAILSLFTFVNFLTCMQLADYDFLIARETVMLRREEAVEAEEHH